MKGDGRASKYINKYTEIASSSADVLFCFLGNFIFLFVAYFFRPHIFPQENSFDFFKVKKHIFKAALTLSELSVNR